MMIAGTAISAAGTVLGGISSYQTGKANEKALNAQADARLEKGKYDTEQADIRFRREQGKVLAGIGTSGVDARSFLDVLTDDAAESSLEKQSIKFGATVDSNNLRYQGKVQRAQGKAALIGSIFSAAGTVASGYGKVTASQIKGA